MDNAFFERPILNSPYEYPRKHWELDATGQPTGATSETRRRAEFITPIPKPKKRKAGKAQAQLDLNEADASAPAQKYDPTPIINELRQRVETWRALPHPNQWLVTPETAIWLTEVAPQTKDGKRFLDYLAAANANPGLARLEIAKSRVPHA